MKRRDVLKIGGTAIAGSLIAAMPPSSGRKKKVIVMGGGIAGLSCAYELMKRGHDVVVLEATGRTGGHVRTMHDPLADGLYADLYGTTTREGARVSKLNSYTGRGSLEGWLRTVMAQEHVNRYRKQKRLVSLDEESDEGGQFAAPEPAEETAADPKLVAATDEALAALTSDDRFVLASYYLDGRTLAEIAKMLGVHESTVSRKVDKLGKSLRKQIVAGLLRHGMSRRQAEEALEVDVRDVSMNLRARLVQDSGTTPFRRRKEEAPAGDGTGS